MLLAFRHRTSEPDLFLSKNDSRIRSVDEQTVGSLVFAKNQPRPSIAAVFPG